MGDAVNRHPALVPTERFPVVDPTLPHQIVIREQGVSCNCRRYGRDQYTFFPVSQGGLPTLLDAYYDVRNHVGLEDLGE